MIEERGKVVDLRPDWALIEILRQTACGRCAAQSGCGTGALGKFFTRKPVQLWVRQSSALEIGQHVILGIHEKALLSSSFVTYFIPLLSLFAGALLGKWCAEALSLNGESLPVLFAIMGFVLSLLWLRRLSNRLQSNSDFQPVILRAFWPAENLRFSQQ